MADEQKILKGQAFFNYSVILPDLDDEEKEVLIMGNFIIENTGEEALNTPVICIQIKPAESGKLGGKIDAAPRNEMIVDATNSEEWQYLNQERKEKAKETGEYWLRPKECDKLQPAEKLFFSNFDLKLTKPKEKNSVIVDGYIYFKELQQGTPALNKIIINF
ncbi:hypothetical protein [Alkalihalobacillus sp. BA299]|uniref:hypothetical protein n=1 Tax=Alkalihalobacillus sp. BA299 TaxID=2815938 RepID=UPI001AD98234|nr:hypothetical protein [Alkalihalobacillus sp. BA299]